MTDPETIARVVRSLTKAQREAVVREGGATATARAVFDAGLFGSISFDGKARYAFLRRPTLLGLAVRLALADGGEA